MNQWDIVCHKCGKFILTEQKQGDMGDIKCIKGSYDNGFYDEAENQFYCLRCAENIKRDTGSYNND